LPVAHRIGPEELERPELPLFRQEPHAQQRQDEQRDQPVVEKHEAPEAGRQARAPEQHEEDEIAVEEGAGDKGEDGGEPVGERAAEQRRELAAADEERLPHLCSPGPTSARNASSSDVSSGASARRPQPRPVTSAARRARTSSPGSASTRQRAWPFAGGSRSTCRTPGTAASAATSACPGAAASTSIRELRRSRAASPAGRSAASTRPR